MRVLLAILVFVFLSSLSFAQNKNNKLPIIDGKIIFTNVVQVDSVSKDQIYSNLKIWFADVFKSAKDVIQVDDKDNGLILGKGILTAEEVIFMTLIKKSWKFTIKIQAKDNRFKYEIYDIVYSIQSPNSTVSRTSASINLDDYFLDKSNYQKNGNLKNKAEKIDNETKSKFDLLILDLIANAKKMQKIDNNW